MTTGTSIHEHQRRRRWLAILLASFLIGALYFKFVRSPQKLGAIAVRLSNGNMHLPQHVSFERNGGTKGYDHIATNRTLGFERVYLINQAHRRDRMTEMQLLLQQYNVQYTVMEAVEGAKEMPALSGEQQRQHGKSQSHAKVWQRMLAENVNSALILEDTFDMDKRFEEQLLRLQAPLAAMLHIAHSGRNDTSLTVDDAWNTALWDMLWLGHCAEQAWLPNHLSQAANAQTILPNLRGAPYLTYRDPTRSRVAHHKAVYEAYGLPTNDEDGSINERLRIVQPAFSPRCTTAYAITRHGAARALYQSAHKPQIRELDVDLNELIGQGRLRAYTVIPSIFARRLGKDGSTNDGALVGDAEWHNVPVPGAGGQTNGIDNSARQHLLADIMGSDRVIVRQKAFLEAELAEKQKGQ